MPQSERYARCLCDNCGGHIEFPRDAGGQSITCPHCQWPTLLPAQAGAGAAAVAAEAKRGVVWRMIIVALLVAIAAAAGFYKFYYLPKIKNAAGPNVTPTQSVVHARTASGAPSTSAIVKHSAPDPWHGLMAAPVTLEKSGDGNLIYAVGKLHNASNRERFGVTVKLRIYDGARHKLGTATDYTSSILPGKDWQYRALVTDPSAKKARLISVAEN